MHKVFEELLKNQFIFHIPEIITLILSEVNEYVEVLISMWWPQYFEFRAYMYVCTYLSNNVNLIDYIYDKYIRIDTREGCRRNKQLILPVIVNYSFNL